MPNKERGSSFRDVARLAGVSLATVSRVASGRAQVRGEIQIKVREAAERLSVTLGAGTRSRVISFLLCNRELLHPIHSRIFLGAEGFCVENGWELAFQSFRYTVNTPAKNMQLPSILTRRDVVRAVIVGGSNTRDLIEALQRHGLAVTIFGNNLIGDLPAGSCDVVYMDDVEGAREMTRYLIRLGHTHIRFVGNDQLPWVARTASGYREVMEEHGLEACVSGLHSDERQAGYLTTRQLLSRREPMTAIFASSDATAEGVYRALRELNLDVPEDISVVGVNDTEGAILHPALTTIRSFPEEIGYHLAELAVSRLMTPDLPAREISIPTQIVRRDSCRAPMLGGQGARQGGRQPG